MAEPRITAAADAIVQGNNEFAFDLYSNLAQAGKSNLFFSPYGISSVLVMTLAGARGCTEHELAKILRFDAVQDELHPFFARLNELILAGSKDLYVASRLWAQKGYCFRAEFLQLLRSNYGVDLEQTDFGGLTHRKINQWVEEQTAGKIRDLISPPALSESTRLLLVNAVYFMGDWTQKFDEADTKEASFFLGLGKKVEVQMMHQQTVFSYAKVGGIQILELPYRDRGLSMVLLLPKRVGRLAKLEAALSVSEMNRWLTALSPQTVEVFLPRFSLREQFALSDVLRTMGMASAFSEIDADFSGMTDEQPGLYISDVLHQAFVEVNEEGTEAAAATAVVMALRSAAFHRPPPVPVFRADHPFVFMIRHRASGSILFLGRVVNPKA